MKAILDLLANKKTYIIVAFVVIGTLLETAGGIDIPGFEPADNWLEYIMAALGLGTLRAGVAKVQNPPA